MPHDVQVQPSSPPKKKTQTSFGSFHLKAGSRSAVHLELQYSHKVSSGEQMTPPPLAPLGNSCWSAGPSSASSARTSVASHCGKSVRFDESPFFLRAARTSSSSCKLPLLSLDTSARANVISDDEYIRTTSHHHDRCSSAPMCVTLFLFFCLFSHGAICFHFCLFTLLLPPVFSSG